MRRLHLSATTFAACAIALIQGCAGGPAPDAPRPVVVYTSVDQQLAEPILAAFSERSGVPLQPVFDTEATKTTGLVNRLIAERAAPRADVFWNSEVLRTIALQQQGVLEPYISPQAASIPAAFKAADASWTGQALRARVFAWSGNDPDFGPGTLEAIVEPVWRERVALAYPLFGTTGSHVAALFATWGEAQTTSWLRAIQENDLRVVDGNSTARDLAVRGSIDVALTDTDDFAVAVARGDAVSMQWAADRDGHTFVIPSTVALIRGGPNPDGGRQLVDFLLSPQAEQMLIEGEGAFMPLRPDAPWPRGLPDRAGLHPLPVDYVAVAAQLEPAMRLCRELFVRR